VILVGQFTGQKIQDIKKKMQKKLIDADEGVIYYEPEKTIISRYVFYFKFYHDP